MNFMSQILLALVALASLIISFTKASASAIRINDVFEQKSDMKEGDTPVLQEDGAPKVVFDNVCFAYKGNKDSLTNLSFAAKAGQTIGIIGGTGSGKSTLVNLIPRFYDVREGAVKMDGVNVKDYPFGQLRRKVGVVPQNAVLFSGTIRDNMKWGKKDASDEEIYRALELAQAKEFVDNKPEGLDTKILQGGKNLPGGQRQRLTIARALVGQPEVLILDDSASALDFATDSKLRRALTALPKGMTAFIVSQRATTIRGANQIIVLDDGAVAGIGTHLELFETCEVYKEICLSQLSEKELGRS